MSYESSTPQWLFHQLAVLRPGQYGRVRAVVGTIEKARLIPQRAVQELQGRTGCHACGGIEIDWEQIVKGLRGDAGTS